MRIAGPRADVLDGRVTAGATIERSHRSTLSFYSWMSLIFVLIAFSGFARTYLIPVATTQFKGAAILHVHGLLFFAWTILFALQTVFVGRRRVDLHRAAGMIGISLAAAMVVTAVLLVVRGLSYSMTIDNEPAARTLAIIPMSQISMFAAFVATAVANARRPESHKRLMLLATISLLPAAMGRLFALFLGPVSAVGNALPNFGAITNPNLAFTAGSVAAGVVDLLIVAALIRDWRTRGRPHRAYVIGGVCMVLVHVLRIPFSRTALWHSITDVLAALAA